MSFYAVLEYALPRRKVDYGPIIFTKLFKVNFFYNMSYDIGIHQMYYILLYFIIFYYNLLYFTMFYFTYILLYFTIFYYVLLYYILLCFIIFYYNLLYFTIFYFTIFYYILLYHMAQIYCHINQCDASVPYFAILHADKYCTLSKKSLTLKIHSL